MNLFSGHRINGDTPAQSGQKSMHPGEVSESAEGARLLSEYTG